jgi:alpha-mannosidase
MSGGALQVRLFNAEGVSGVKRLEMGFKARAVKIVELDGREVKELPVHRDKGGRRWVELSIPRYGIRTLKFDHV